MVIKKLIIILLVTIISIPSYSIVTEVSLSYNYLKRTFDELNWFANQSTSAGVSIYLGERIALELGYTNGLYVKKERENSLSETAQRTTTQHTTSADLSAIFLFSERKAQVQPYAKCGVSHIQRRQEVQSDNDIPLSVNPPDAYAPSAGVGVKFLLSEQFSFRAGLDAVQTPIDESSSVTDLSGRAGISIIF